MSCNFTVAIDPGLIVCSERAIARLFYNSTFGPVTAYACEKHLDIAKAWTPQLKYEEIAEEV